MGKRWLFLLLALALCVSLLSAGPMVVKAEAAGTTYSVTDFGANGSDTNDDFAAFRAALEKGINATASNPVTITVPAGTYYISYNLAIYSNTTLSLDSGATVIATYDKDLPMLHSVHLNDDGNICEGKSCSHGGYSQVENITVEGGVWDRNSKTTTNSSVMIFRHGKNITIRNMTMKNCNNHHLNLSGIDTALVENVTFRDAIKYNGSDTEYWGGHAAGDNSRYDSVEAVHLDYCSKEGEYSDAAMPCDNTASRNITVRYCTFSNIYSGVGTHHPAESAHGANISVYENTATDIKSFLVYAYDFDNVTVRDNTITRGGGIVVMWGTDAKVQNNYFTGNLSNDAQLNAIYVVEGSEAEISGNTILDAEVNAISVKDGSSITAENNTIQNPASHGICLQDNSTAVVKNNQISDLATAKTSGIYLNGNCSLTASGNTIQNVTDHGVYLTENSSATVTSNDISNTGGSGLWARNGSALEAESNNISSTGAFLIYGTENAKLTVKNNTLDGTESSPAIKVDGCAPSTIQGNTVKSSARHGIVVQESSGTVVSDNTLTDLGGHGIHILSSADCVVENNTVRNNEGHGIVVEGTSSLPGTAVIQKNTLSSGAGYRDLRLGEYAKDCVLCDNTLEKNGMTAHDTATYTESSTAVDTGTGDSGKAGWVKESGVWHFYKSGKMVTNGWAKDGSYWCYMGKDGAAVTKKWVQADGHWYYFDGAGHAVCNGWANDGQWCWMDADGVAITNKWQKADGHWYYFDENGHAVCNGWAKDGTYWCWMDANGIAITNKWQKADGKWYYFNSSGHMVANGWAKDGAYWCYMDGSGIAVTKKWVKADGNWYYFDGAGHAVCNGWAHDGVGWCWMDKNGIAVIDTTVDTDEGPVYFDKNGHAT